MGERKNYSGLPNGERERFIRGLYALKASGLIDQYAGLHAAHFRHGIHRSSHFLPWHREFILRFERALQELDPRITLPYWDSTINSSPADPMWGMESLGQFDSAWGLKRVLGSDTLPTETQVSANLMRTAYGEFWIELERGIHNSPHNWVGGVMASTASPGDPTFFLHHCWIDLLWTRWQSAHPTAVFESSNPGSGINDPLMEWPDRTPAAVLHHRALGYYYEVV